MTIHPALRATARFLLGALALSCYLGVAAQEAEIKRSMKERFPSIAGDIDEVRETEMKGLYEVRFGSDIVYTDAKGDFLIQGGELLDTRARRNLTRERIEKLSAIDFTALPFKDAFTIVRGNGSRTMAVFQDPNCSYCKHFERDLKNVDNVTIHMFLYPILGENSVEKARDVWCSADKAKAWDAIMVKDQPIPSQSCDDAKDVLARNVDMGRKFRITGTPTVIFSDGTRAPGAISSSAIEARLSNNPAPASH